MTCAEVEALLVEASDRALDVAVAVRLSAHLESCAGCATRASLWGRLVPGMRALAPAEPDAMRVRRMQIEIERQLSPAARVPVRAAGGWRPRWIVAAGLTAAAAAALALFLARRSPAPAAPPAYATVLQIQGQLSDGARVLAPAEGLGADSQLALAVGGHADLGLARGTRVRIDGPARVVLGGNPRAVALRLEHGTLNADVAHRLPGETFAVSTRDLRVEVRGTRFTVGADGPGAAPTSWVRVAEGRVDVRLANGEVRSVAAGETLSWPPAPAAAPVPAEAGAGEPAPAAPASTCGEATRACESMAHAARERMRAGDQQAALRLLASPAAPRSPARAGAACGRAALACQDELGYLRAEALRGLGRADDAVAAYRHLGERGKPPAMRQNALYAAAEIERRRGHLALARTGYERALAASPRGALREEAMLGAMDCASAAGERGVAVRLARRYLGAFPRGIGAARAQQISGGGERP